LNDFSKEYRTLCATLMKPWGFKMYKSNCYRITNDIFQFFYYQLLTGGGACYVVFGAIPLCCDIMMPDKEYPRYMYHLNCFSKPLRPYVFQNTEEGINGFMTKLHHDFQAYMLPFFREAVDCVSACGAVDKLEAQLDKHLFDSTGDPLTAKAYMLLKAGDHDEALECFRIIMRERTNWATTNLNGQDTVEGKREWENTLQQTNDEWQQRISLLEDHDQEQISRWLFENERKSLEALGLLKPERN